MTIAPERTYDADVIIVGGGPAGATLGTLLAQNGRKVLIIEKDIHPRDHVGESLVPSTNIVFHRIADVPGRRRLLEWPGGVRVSQVRRSDRHEGPRFLTETRFSCTCALAHIRRVRENTYSV